MSTIWPDSPRARATDPETSHEASESLSGDHIRESQLAVLMVLRSEGAMCDRDLLAYTDSWFTVGGEPEFSPSRVRTARHELVELGFVKFTGDYDYSRPRRQRTWDITVRAAA